MAKRRKKTEAIVTETLDWAIGYVDAREGRWWPRDACDKGDYAAGYLAGQHHPERQER